MRSRGWAELYDWRLDRDSATPVFRQIYAQVRADPEQIVVTAGTQQAIDIAVRVLATGCGWRIPGIS